MGSVKETELPLERLYDSLCKAVDRLIETEPRRLERKKQEELQKLTILQSIVTQRKKRKIAEEEKTLRRPVLPDEFTDEQMGGTITIQESEYAMREYERAGYSRPQSTAPKLATRHVPPEVFNQDQAQAGAHAPPSTTAAEQESHSADATPSQQTTGS